MTSGQCRAARIVLGWTQADLTKRSAVRLGTVERFEAGKSVPHGAEESTRYRFEAAGIRFQGDWGICCKAGRR